MLPCIVDGEWHLLSTGDVLDGWFLVNHVQCQRHLIAPMQKAGVAGWNLTPSTRTTELCANQSMRIWERKLYAERF